jgi:hypothetical protein
MLAICLNINLPEAYQHAAIPIPATAAAEITPQN